MCTRDDRPAGGITGLLQPTQAQSGQKRLKSTRESGGLPEPLGPESLLHRLAGVLAHSAPRAECAKHVFELHKSNCGSQASGQTTLAAGAPPTQRMFTGLVCSPRR